MRLRFTSTVKLLVLLYHFAVKLLEQKLASALVGQKLKAISLESLPQLDEDLNHLYSFQEISVSYFDHSQQNLFLENRSNPDVIDVIFETNDGKIVTSLRPRGGEWQNNLPGITLSPEAGLTRILDGVNSLAERLGLELKEDASTVLLPGSHAFYPNISSERALTARVKVKAIRTDSFSSGSGVDTMVRKVSNPYELLNELKASEAPVDLRLLYAIAANHTPIIESGEYFDAPLVTGNLDESSVQIAKLTILQKGIIPESYIFVSDYEQSVGSEKRRIRRSNFTNNWCQTLDSIELIPYFVSNDGEIYLALNKGERLTDLLRSSVSHPLYISEHGSSIEPLKIDYARDEGRSDQTVSEILNLFSHSLIKHCRLAFGTQSPAFIDHLTSVEIAEVSPRYELPASYAWYKLSDVSRKINDGTIGSISIKIACGVLDPELKSSADSSTTSISQRFTELVAKGNEFHSFLREHFPNTSNRIQGNDTIYALLEEGWKRGCRFNASDNAPFYALIPWYGHPTNLSEVAKLEVFLHDIFHFKLGDIVPTEDLSEEDYISLVLKNEAAALLFSDVVLPELYGREAWEKETGKISLYTILTEIGITDRIKQFECIHYILLSGEVPKEFAADRQRYGTYLATIAEKLTGYHVRDKLHILPKAYEYFTKHPVTTKSLKEFAFRSFSDPQTYQEQIEHVVVNISSISIAGGVNGVEAKLEELRNRELLLCALNISFLIDEKLGDINEHKKILIELAEFKVELDKLLDKPRGIDQPGASISALVLAEKFEKRIDEIYAIAENYGLSSNDIPLFSAPFHLERATWKAKAIRLASEPLKSQR